MKYSLCDARLKIQKIKISPFTNFYKVFTWNCLDSTGISHVAFSTQIKMLMAKCKQWHQQRSNCYVCIFAGDQLNCYKPQFFFLAVKISRQCQTFLPYRIPTVFWRESYDNDFLGLVTVIFISKCQQPRLRHQRQRPLKMNLYFSWWPRLSN